MFGFGYLCVAALARYAVAAPTEQIPILQEVQNGGLQAPFQHAPQKRPLHGRFLHITDFHPDRFYQVYSSTVSDAACHRGQGPAGIYGAETSECDSPIELVNATMKWIEQEFRDSVDFVIWTGDSARHDNDDEYPRSVAQVQELNDFMVHKMLEVFGKRNGDEEDEDPNNDFEVPVVPNLGNNDILPHNIMSKGPNLWTRAYTKIWRQFIPEAQRHSFEQGGWFYVEVIPHKLAVLSLNTVYFFDSNAAVDGCASPHEPGYQHMEWLRIQLQFMRERGMKAILMGHVPPARNSAKQSWDETCWQKYTLWVRQYRDVIVSSHYGHMNYDHFMLQDFEDLDEDTKEGRMPSPQIEEVGSVSGDENDGDDVHGLLSSNYFIELREMWSKLPKPPKTLDWPTSRGQETQANEIDSRASKSKKDKKRKHDKEKERQKKHERFIRKMGGPFAERFAASFVTASVVPNLFPTIRVYEYNTTGLERSHSAADLPLAPSEEELTHFDDEVSKTSWFSAARRKKQKYYKFKVPEGPSKSAPPGPAYSPQTLSLLKYTQYFANITRINNDFTNSVDEDEDEDGEFEATKWHEGKHRGKKPHGKDHTPKPKKFKYELHYDTQEDDVYQLKDLTMPHLVELARRIGEFKPPEELNAVEEDGMVSVEEGEDDVLPDLDAAKHKKHKKKKKKKKKHHKHGQHNKRNEAWYTFIRRAFVETLDSGDIEEEFGH